MKKLQHLLSVFMILCVCIACSETDDFTEIVDSELKSAKIMIKPSKAADPLIKAKEDWANISTSLKSAKKGEKVQLSAGTFYLHKSIICWDFEGVFCGSGIHKTIIETAPGMEFDVRTCPDLEWSWGTNEGHAILCFPHNKNNQKRNVIISDLTIKSSEPSTVWMSNEGPRNSLIAVQVYYSNLLGISGYWGDQTLSDQIDLSVVFKNLSVVGEQDYEKYLEHGYSFSGAFAASGASSGSFEAKNIQAENIFNGLTPVVFCGENSVVSIKNFKVVNAQVGIYSWVDTYYDIKNCVFSECQANAMNINSYNHIYDLDFKGAIIKGNQFNMNSQWNGITGIRLNNVQVRDNIFAGNCFSGIFAGRGELWEINDNNLCNLTVTNPEAATIRIHNTMNSTVYNNANQVLGGNSYLHPSNTVGEAINCFK